jgi:hypothetical protein
MKQVAWGLVIVGGVLQMAESAAQASATLNNTLFSQSTIGSIVAPIEKYTPVSLGWTLLITGSVLLLYQKGKA